MRLKYSVTLDGFNHIARVFNRKRKALRYARRNATFSYDVRAHPFTSDLSCGVGFGQCIESQYEESDPEMQVWLDP